LTSLWRASQFSVSPPTGHNLSRRGDRSVTVFVLLQCHGMARTALIVFFATFCLTTLNFGQTVTSQDASKLRSLRERAERGDAQAQSELGFMYEFGIGGAQRDYAEALEWYRKAVELGDTGARLNIGGMYFEGIGVTRDYAEAARWYGCPRPSVQALASCRETSYKDLPQEALNLLTKMKCDVDSNYDYGSAVDLNGDGDPEYQVCCHDAPHGPCAAAVIGKVGSAWRELNEKGGVLGFEPPCRLFIVLDSRHGGFNDVCLPAECSTISSPTGKPCVPTIWHFVDGRYRSVEYTPVAPPK
jgi:hypothetical protein